MREDIAAEYGINGRTLKEVSINTITYERSRIAAIICNSMSLQFSPHHTLLSIVRQYFQRLIRADINKYIRKKKILTTAVIKW